jgi:hypothetical protein
MLYYLRPWHWLPGEIDPYPNTKVSAVVHWLFEGGVDHLGYKLHEPGVEAHFEWHMRNAERKGQMFAVVVTLPELREHDQAGKFEEVLKRDFELALYLPMWVGPKDQSIYVYLPKKTE